MSVCERENVSVKQKVLDFTGKTDKEEEVKFYDYGGFLKILNIAYENKMNVLIIGPKGTGKTQLVRKFAQMKGKRLREINFSLRTRESHLLGFSFQFSF